MTFSSNVREEIAHTPLEASCCRIAYLAAVLRGTGSLHLTGGGHAHAEIDVGSHAVGRQVLTALREEGVMCGVSAYTPERLGLHQRLQMVLAEDEASTRLLRRTGVIDDQGRPRLTVAPSLIARECCQIAVLRGAFAAAGSVSPPGKPAHLEIRTHGADFAALLASACAQLGIPVQTRQRERWAEVMSRRRESVQDLLTVLGAEGAALDVAEDEVVRSARGDANRRANFDNANLTRQVQAARQQTAAIAVLRDSGALATLTPALREAAHQRLDNPEMTLSELAEASGVARPTLAGRLRRLIELAEAEAELGADRRPRP
ncbi:MAG: DNA-binding protein WhiA [Thermoleophilia bacterium]